MAEQKTLANYVLDGGIKDRVFLAAPDDRPYRVLDITTSQDAAVEIRVSYFPPYKSTRFEPLSHHIHDKESSLHNPSEDRRFYGIIASEE